MPKVGKKDFSYDKQDILIELLKKNLEIELVKI